MPFVYISSVKPRTKSLIGGALTDGVDVVVEGRLGHDNTFRATTLLAKCASRYENAPDKYRNTPGYKQAEQRA
jgi:cytochrome c-type biogenesis protein CcmE